MREFLSRLKFEPVIIGNLILAVAAFAAVEVNEDQIRAGVDTAFQVAAVVGPIVTALFTRLFTRSKASLQEEAADDAAAGFSAEPGV